MKFEVLAELQVGVFYPLTIEDKKGYVVYPIQKIPTETSLFVKEFEPTSHLTAGFKVGHFAAEDYPGLNFPTLGYLFYSKMPILNYGTGVLSYSLAWQKSNANHHIPSDQVSAVFRNEHFYMYEAPSIATLVTGAEVSTGLEDFLTMI